MYKLYAIQSEIRNYIYVGSTKNLVERIKRYNRGYKKKQNLIDLSKLFMLKNVKIELKQGNESNI